MGFACESTADFQKMAFKNKPANKGKFIDTGQLAMPQNPCYKRSFLRPGTQPANACTGLWAYAKYPQYCGEILMWCAWSTEHLPLCPILTFRPGCRYACLQVGHLAHVCRSTLRRLLGNHHQPGVRHDPDSGCQWGPSAGMPQAAEPSSQISSQEASLLLQRLGTYPHV